MDRRLKLVALAALLWLALCRSAFAYGEADASPGPPDWYLATVWCTAYHCSSGYVGTLEGYEAKLKADWVTAHPPSGDGSAFATNWHVTWGTTAFLDFGGSISVQTSGTYENCVDSDAFPSTQCLWSGAISMGSSGSLIPYCSMGPPWVDATKKDGQYKCFLTPAPSCPPSSKKSQVGSCICDEGYKPGSGGTTCEPHTCMTTGAYSRSTVPDQKVSTADTHQCMDGCRVVARSVSLDADGNFWAQWPFVSLGSNAFCGGLPEVLAAVKPPEDLTGSTSLAESGASCPAGWVAGLGSVCIESPTTVTSVDAVDAAGNGTSEVTVCEGGVCTTTTHTVTNGVVSEGGGVTIGASGVGAPGSTGGGGGSGSGDGEPTPSMCEATPNAAACKGLGSAPTAPDLGGLTKTLTITPLSGFGPSSFGCPADKTATLALGITLHFPWTLFCTFADGIRPVVVGMAWLSAALAFVGFSRKGD